MPSQQKQKYSKQEELEITKPVYDMLMKMLLDKLKPEFATSPERLLMTHELFIYTLYTSEPFRNFCTMLETLDCFEKRIKKENSKNTTELLTKMKEKKWYELNHFIMSQI